MRAVRDPVRRPGPEPAGPGAPVLYVGGSGRSGSTLLDRMLAAVPGFCSVGEIEYIWRRGLQRDDRCGCGARFSECPFWTQVGQAAFGGWDQIDTARVVSLSQAVDRHRHLDRLAGLRGPGPLAGPLAEYTELTGRLYQAVREVSGADVIVDSSKNLSYALLVRRVPGVDLRLAHLVRRSHGVAYSWSRRVRKPSVGDGTEFMSVRSPAWSVGFWLTDNVLFELLGRSLDRATFVRYEDLVENPRAVLLRLIADLDLPAADLSLGFLAGDQAELPLSHGISGNPMRSRQGQIVVRADEEWRTAMSLAQRAAITAATWPLLRRYGYPATTRAPRERTGPGC